MSGRILELRIDKFIFRFPEDRYYSEAGIWARFEDKAVRIGLSDFAQQRNGDVAFAEPKAVGAAVSAGEEIAVVETVKVNLSVPSPVGGTIVEVNRELETSPELVNQDPYGGGWLAVVEVEDGEAAKGALRSAAGFLPLAEAQAETEAPR